MTDVINWHPNGTPGPWKKVETPDYAEIHNEVISTPVALVGISTTDARAIAEVPAMVVALREDVQRYDAANPMRTADCHRAACDCGRCRIDHKRAILARISAEMHPAVGGAKRQMSLDDLVRETGL